MRRTVNTCKFCGQTCVDVNTLPEGTTHLLGELMLGHTKACPWRQELAKIAEARKALLCPCGEQNKRSGYKLCGECLEISAAYGEPAALFMEGGAQ